MEKLPAHVHIPSVEDIESLDASDKSYLSVEAISYLRHFQYNVRNSLRHETLTSDPSADLEATDAATYDSLHDLNHEYLTNFIGEDDEMFEEYLSHLDSLSINNMSYTEFNDGPLDDDGNPDASQAGWLKAYRYHQEATKASDPNIDDDGKGIDIPDPVNPVDPDVDTTPIPVDTAEYDAAINNLNLARDALAKAEVQFRTRKWFNGPKSRTELKRLRDLYEEASYNASLAHFTKLKEEQDDVLEIEALRAEAATFFANEFKAYTDAQNNTEYFTKHGKKARALGEASLGKKLKKAILPLGITALGALTGGTGALIGFGIATGMRLKSNIDGGTIGHRTKNQSEALIHKKTKKTKESIDSIIGTLNTDEIGEAARIIASGHKQTAENIHKSNVNRRRFTGAVIGAGALLGAVKIAQNYDNVQSMWQSIKNFSPFDENKIIEKDKYPDVVFKDYAKPWEVRPSVTTNLGDIDSSILGSVHDSLQPRLPQVPEGVTSEMLRNLDHLLHANGSTPYAKALDFYGGDSKGASAWLQMAIDKTPGARWVGSSQGGMISINGRTDTGYVWDTLTKSMLK